MKRRIRRMVRVEVRATRRRGDKNVADPCASEKRRISKVDLGLAIARWHAQPGVGMTQAVLAAFCECSQSNKGWRRRRPVTRPRLTNLLEPRCQVCGCTELAACIEPWSGHGCAWVDAGKTLCTVCAARGKLLLAKAKKALKKRIEGRPA